MNQLRYCVTAVLALAIVGALALGFFDALSHVPEALKAEMQRKRKEQRAQLEHAVKLFDKLDEDKDGLLFKEELRNHALGGVLTGEELDTATRLYHDCERIGHSVGSYRSGKYTFSLYAISKVDLKLWEQKIEEELKREYPGVYQPPTSE